MSQQLSELCDRYAAAHGARATWIVRAGNAADVLAQTGIVGTHDRIVAFSGAGRARWTELFRWQHLSFADELTPQAFCAASELVDAEQAERDRLVPQGSPASYAHPAGISSGRLFWFAPSIDAATLRVADIRALAAAAQTVGAILVIDNTLPTPFGCRPLAQGAHVVVEALEGMAPGMLSSPLVAVSVARSQVAHGRHRSANPVAEDAFRLLSFGLGAPGTASAACAPSASDVAALAAALDTLAEREQACFDHARAIASYLSCHSAVGFVRYPGLATHPDCGIAARTLEHGFGSVVGFCLTGSCDEAPRARRERFRALFEHVHAARRSFADARASISIVDTDEACYLQLFAGVDDPIDVVDSLDQALRLFCNPPEP